MQPVTHWELHLVCKQIFILIYELLRNDKPNSKQEKIPYAESGQMFVEGH